MEAGNLWAIYQEAELSIAVVNEALRIFIRLPVFDEVRRFRMYHTIQLVKAVNNASHGVRYGELPEVLAILDDLQSFVELMGKDAANCDSAAQTICHFHTGIARRTGRKFCIIALFLNESREIDARCKRVFAPWRGREAVYLGERHWAVSSNKEQEIVVACPPVGSEPTQTITHLLSS